jgi:phosphatidylinositol 4-kinase
MIDIMGGSYDKEPFNYFVDLTIKAFLAIRRYEEHILNVIRLMVKSGLKCFLPPTMQVRISVEISKAALELEKPVRVSQG